MHSISRLPNAPRLASRHFRYLPSILGLLAFTLPSGIAFADQAPAPVAAAVVEPSPTISSLPVVTAPGALPGPAPAPADAALVAFSAASPALPPAADMAPRPDPDHAVTTPGKRRAAADNGVTPEARLGVTLDPSPLPVGITVTVEAGHNWSRTAPATEGLPAVGYDYANFHGGPEFGDRSSFRFFLQAGASWLDVSAGASQSGSLLAGLSTPCRRYPPTLLAHPDFRRSPHQ
jgi:hypothetical protein